MMMNVLRGRASSDAADENRFAIYSPEWFFARYTGLMNNDLEREVPIKYGLTLSDALAFVPVETGWDRTFANLHLEMAIAGHRAKYWEFSNIDKIWLFSPVSVELIMPFLMKFGDDETGDIIDRKIRQLAYFRQSGNESEDLTVIINDTVRALSSSLASVLFHNLIYSGLIDRAIELEADAQFLSRLITSKTSSDAVVKSYAG